MLPLKRHYHDQLAEALKISHLRIPQIGLRRESVPNSHQSSQSLIPLEPSTSISANIVSFQVLSHQNIVHDTDDSRTGKRLSITAGIQNGHSEPLYLENTHSSVTRDLVSFTYGTHSRKLQGTISLFDYGAVLSICNLSTPYRMPCWVELLLGRSHGHPHGEFLWKTVPKDLIGFLEHWDFSKLARAYCLVGHHESGPYKATIKRAIHGIKAFPGVSGRESLPRMWTPFMVLLFWVVVIMNRFEI